MTEEQPVTTEIRRRPGATENSKQRIFAAALELMGRQGVSATTVEDIATAAGLAKGTVFYNFGSKAKMVGELLKFGFDLLAEGIESAAARVNEPGQLRIQAMVAAAIDFLRDYPNYLHLWISHAWRPGSPWLEDSARMRTQLLALVEDELRELPVHRDDIDPPVVAAAMIGTLFLLSQEQMVFGVKRGKDELLETVMLTIHGYCASAASTKKN
ncbi:TetR/AcrR family transcriptional regulator [Micrococcoides hystricis]|uniref:TetR/AcrR family transcriptional regulator n=1 Tax=Micrococcoides hystricis TaxID=1572761 RepID=A0ABV6PAI6_9MICC